MTVNHCSRVTLGISIAKGGGKALLPNLVNEFFGYFNDSDPSSTDLRNMAYFKLP